MILVRSAEASFWNSCRSIVQNLELVYREAFKKVSVLGYSEGLKDQDLKSSLEKLELNSTDTIVFIDHFPTISQFILCLESLKLKELPMISMHTFGDFNIRSNEYFGLESILKKYNFKVIAPSTRAKNHIELLMKTNVNIFPFPININKSKIKKIEIDIPINHKVIVSIGRLSFQKQSLRTLEIVIDVLKSNPLCSYIIAGSFDDHGIPVYYRKNESKDIEDEFTKKIKGLSVDLQSRIHLLGEVEKENICSLLNKSDLFISLSTYHTEDFGMAPLEALACGVPCLLTDWGGYSDFAQDNFCQLIPVSLTDNGLHFDNKLVIESIHNFLSKELSQESQNKNIEIVYKRFGVKSLSSCLKKLYNSQSDQFSGFTDYVKVFYWINKKGLKLDVRPNTLYEELFRGFYEH